MRRFFLTGAASLLALSVMVGSPGAAAVSDNAVLFDFERDDSGFAPIYADYPSGMGVEAFYEFQHSYGEVPIDGAGNGIFISGNNHSDDLFMGYVKELGGFAPWRMYHFTVSFLLATKVERGMFGVGGAPGENVIVKCGITPIRPAAELVSGYYRMNIDTGHQGNSGKDMVIVGDMAKTESRCTGAYEFKEFSAEFDAAANALGEIYLIIGTDSGFEAATSYYLDDISVSWEEAGRQPIVTRAQAARMLFHTADRPSADPANCPFQDVAVGDPNREAITWAQEGGVLVGCGSGMFCPEKPMTVEQALVMIWRFVGSPAADLSVLSAYSDHMQLSAWARDSAAWAIANGVYQPNEKIGPTEPITMEQLSRCLGQIAVACG